MTTRTDHDRKLALRLMVPGETPMTEAEAVICFKSMTMPERRRAANRFLRLRLAFEQELAAGIQAVHDEICAIAANLPPDIGE